MNSAPIHITYHPQRSSTARIKNNEIFLRISTFATRSQQQDHIENLLKKIKRSFPKNTSKKKISLIPSLESGILKLNTGVIYHLKIKLSKRKNIHFEKSGNTLFILTPIKNYPAFQTHRNSKLHNSIEPHLWRYLCKDQIKPLTQKLNFLIQNSHFPSNPSTPWISESFNRLTLKTTTSRWGSCDKRTKTIMLCVKLLLIEEELLDYVCIHELAHLKHSNHSNLFWNLVEQKLPNWKFLRRRLNHHT